MFKYLTEFIEAKEDDMIFFLLFTLFLCLGAFLMGYIIPYIATAMVIFGKWGAIITGSLIVIKKIQSVYNNLI